MYVEWSAVPAIKNVNAVYQTAANPQGAAPRLQNQQ
jgi:hypothetical protein